MTRPDFTALAEARQQWTENEDAVRRDLERGNARPVWSTGSVARNKAQSVDEERGTVVFAITTPEVDRYQDVVVPQGAQLDAFRRNPVVLWNHDYGGLPVARSLREEVVADEAVYSEAEFARGATDGTGVGDFAAAVFNFYARGFLSAVSIGFLPRRWEKRYVEDADGQQVWKGGYVYQEWELLEYSAVPVPANPGALAMTLRSLQLYGDRLGVGPDVVSEIVPVGPGRRTRALTGADLEAVREVVADALDELLVSVYEVAGRRDEPERRAGGDLDAVSEALSRTLRRLALADGPVKV